LKPDGQYRRVRIHAGLSRTPAHRKGPTVVVAVKDLDKLRRAEDLVVERTRDLKQSRVQLREARRLAWLGTVAAGMAHQINNPVGSMLAAAQFALLCEDQPEERDEWRKALQDIESEAKRCGTIVRGIRRFARGESSLKVRENLIEVVASALALVDSYAHERRVLLELESDGDPIPVRISKVDIEEMMVNVLRNAIESEPNKPVRILVDANEKNASIEILDDGCGIPTERVQEVFDPFYTTRLEDGGSGLGLSVVHGVVGDHGGRVEIEQIVEGGTRFRILLPLAKTPAPA
jgi:C4-dicarboxylate-specific signal transduction histidine kinase